MEEWNGFADWLEMEGGDDDVMEGCGRDSEDVNGRDKDSDIMDGRGKGSDDDDAIEGSDQSPDRAGSGNDTILADSGSDIQPDIPEPSKGGEATPTLQVNISKSRVKLGKHVKGPHSKGKEKAPAPPQQVTCCACGQIIHWKRQKLHSHPRLNVIICQVCVC